MSLSRLSTLLGRLRHAFAVEPDRIEVSDEDLAAADRLCTAIVGRRMSAPALVLLEMARPLNYVAGQALWALSPLIGALAGERRVERLAAFLEQRGSIEYLSRRLEAISGEGASEGQGSNLANAQMRSGDGGPACARETPSFDRSTTPS